MNKKRTPEIQGFFSFKYVSDLENRYYSTFIGVVYVIPNLVGVQCFSKSLDLVGILVAIFYNEQVGVGLSSLGISAFNSECISVYLEASSDSIVAIDDCDVNVVCNIGNIGSFKFVGLETISFTVAVTPTPSLRLIKPSC